MTASEIFVESPLGEKALLLRRASGYEELGGPFELSLELLSDTKTALRLTELLGQTMTVHIALPEERTRYFHGYVTDLAETGTSGSFIQHRVTLRPWLWFLTRTANCRIFQGKSVPEIVKELCDDLGFADLRIALTGSYRTWDYVVQYRESDFAFLSRLLEQEGIYYFFEHEQTKHTMVLADGSESHTAVEGYEYVDYFPSSSGTEHDRQILDTWQFHQHVQAGAYVLDDYDFKRPRAALQVRLQAAQPHAHSRYEVYDYPGEYEKTGDGETYVKVRLEELRTQFERMTGAGNVRGLAAGGLFSLAAHPRDDQNQQYLITHSRYEIDLGEYESGGGDGTAFHCSVEVTKSSTPFRPRRTTPRPVIAGHQTAKVVGKAGEEIWTDEFGRVKVQFPWDRKGASNEASSCWVRVAQVWAGSGWGAIHVPRVGQEVLVSFLEGDPDRPIITGRVYNGNSTPPFPLPAQAMVSGTKSESTPGGGGYNEISMDDTKGSEKLVVHGQLDMLTTIEHDKTLTVHNDRTSTIDANDTEMVGINQRVTIGANHVLTVGANSAETIAAAKTLSVGAGYQVSVGAAMNETVAGLKAEEVGGTKSLVVAEASTEKIKGSKSVSVDKDLNEEATLNVELKSGKKMVLSAGDDLRIVGKKKGLIEIADELTIKVGQASIVLKKNGDISIKGKKISVNGSGDVALKGQKVSQN